MIQLNTTITMVTIKSISLFWFLLFISFFILGCDKKNTEQNVSKEIVRDINFKQFTAGQHLFQKNCASCHGKHAEGANNWRKPDAQGKNPPPPLNGTGHAWHHSNKSLMNTIRNGTAKIGGNMPAWKDKLSDSEIKLILTWITAQWPDEIYTAWYNRFHQK